MKRQDGFTLVELIVVIVLVGIIGGVLTMMLAPAIQSYLLVGQRAALTDVADTALRTIARDVRRAVPNSLRQANAQCLELVPTIDGGRYRTGPDRELPGAAYINDAEPGTTFDVLTQFGAMPAKGDLIVVGNRSPDEVYKKTNVAEIDSVSTPPDPKLGSARIVLVSELQVPQSDDGGRFVVVPAARQVVSYRCEGAGLDGAGTGAGRLVRSNGNDLGAAPACSGALPAGAQLVATKVSSCSFIHYANAGATQDSGFVQLQLTLSDKGESVPLTVGVNVSNVP